MTRTARVCAAAALALIAGTASAQSAELAEYFGFDDPRIIVVDDGMGPALAADLDQDGLTDLLVVNDRKSRIEVYRQRQVPRSESDMERPTGDANELPKSPYYDRVDVSVGHAISGFRVVDIDGDGLLDILYAGIPSEVVYMRQTSPMNFEVEAKRRIRGLAAGQDGFEVANVTGDEGMELLAVVDGKINVYDLTSSGVTGEPLRLGSSGQLFAFFVEDFNGDGRMDICGVSPDDDAPVRLWAQVEDRSGQGILGPELRFDMPGVIEVEPLRLEGQKAASLSVIERASRRMVLYDLVTEPVEPLNLSAKGEQAESEATAEVYAFRNSDGDRSTTTADINQDGLVDLLVTDSGANSVVLYKQKRGTGFDAGSSFSAFKKPKAVAAGQWDGSGPLEVFVLSEEEKTIGVSKMNEDTGRLGFPQPLALATAGATPVAMAHVPASTRALPWGGDRDGVVVIVRDRRDHTLEFHGMGQEPVAVELEDVNRPPQSMLAGDFNADGIGDILLFTPNEPLVMVTGGSTPEVRTSDAMPQFGLVQAAGPDNTASLDVDGDGTAELLIADENFVRACAFDDTTGWRVVDQITLPDARTSLTSIATFTERGTPVIAASDRANQRLVMMAPTGDGWDVVETLRVTGLAPDAITAGKFTGDNTPGVLGFSADSFGVVRLGGERVALEEFAAFRSDKDDRLEHEIEFGDINGDGYTDMIVLDAREQMCQIFTLSASRKLFFALEYRVFETRLFGRGDSRTFEPSAAILSDVTGDGATDLILEVHDRYIIYPQMIR